MKYYDIKFKTGEFVFHAINGRRQIETHDYIAIALEDGKHLVIKDRYSNRYCPCGFRKAGYPYVIPYFNISKDSIEMLIKEGEFGIVSPNLQFETLFSRGARRNLSCID